MIFHPTWPKKPSKFPFLLSLCITGYAIASYQQILQNNFKKEFDMKIIITYVAMA
jgi:hypothetical protein